MTQLPPPPCTSPSPSSSRKRGGTLIAAQVKTLAQHEAALADPDLVRPRDGCPRCARVVQVQDRRPRKIAGLRGPTTQVLIFRCRPCRAVWRILPAFLAPRRWWAWARVVAALEGAERRRVPARTRWRWWARLRERVPQLVVALASAGDVELRELANLGIAATLKRLLDAFGGLARLPALTLAVATLPTTRRVLRVL